MRRILAAALLALAASAAVAFDNPVIATPTCTHNNFRILEAVLPSILARSLRASMNPEGLDAARFLDAHLGLEFRVAVDPSQRDAFDGRPALDPDTVMAYSDAEQEILIHHALLHLDGSDEAKIIAEPARLEITARRFWPAIVHETSHARTQHGAERFVAAAVLEDEFIAFYRQLFFVLEQLKSEPGYLGIAALAPCAREHAGLLIRFHAFLPRLRELEALRLPSPARKRELRGLEAEAKALAADETALKGRCPRGGDPAADQALQLSLLAASPEEFEGEIRDTYARRGRLSLDDDALIEHARAATEEDVRIYSDLLARPPASAASAPTLAAMNETTRRILETKRLALAFWNDPRAAPAAVAAYRAQLAEIRAEAEAQRARFQRELKPFLPPTAKERP